MKRSGAPRAVRSELHVEQECNLERTNSRKRKCRHQTDSATAMACGACAMRSVRAAGGLRPSRWRIAVIPKGTTHKFWQSIHAGANRAGKELGVEVIWRGPLREDDRDSQVSEIEGFISRGVSGIVHRAAR